MTSIPIETREQWLELRSRTIGASEIASLFYQWLLPSGRTVWLHMFEVPPADATCLGCASRHKNGFRLYHEKAGRLEPEAVEGERIDAGTFLEPALARWAMKKWDWDLRKVRRYIVHPEIPGMGQSRDYEEVAPGWPPVELKTVDYLIFRDQWAADGDTILVPPMDITLQVQHQIAGTQAQHGWIVAAVAGNNLKRGRIPRHEPTIAKIEEAVRAFWHAVETRQAPDEFADVETVKDLYAAGEKGKVVDLSQDNEAPELCARFLELQQTHKGIGAELDQIKATLAHKIGDATAANLRGFRITWPAIHRPEKEIPAKTQPALDYRGAFTIKETA